MKKRYVSGPRVQIDQFQTHRVQTDQIDTNRAEADSLLFLSLMA